MKLITVYCLLIIMLLMITSCSPAKRIFYFKWQTLRPYVAANDTLSRPPDIAINHPLEIETKENQISASASSGQPIALRKDILREQGRLIEPTFRIQGSGIQKQPDNKSSHKVNLIRTEKVLIESNPKKNWAAKLGLTFSLVGLFMIVIGIAMLSTVPFLLAFLVEFLALIFSIVGLKSEKRKSALIGTWISGIVFGIALALLIAVMLAFRP